MLNTSELIHIKILLNRELQEKKESRDIISNQETKAFMENDIEEIETIIKKVESMIF